MSLDFLQRYTYGFSIATGVLKLEPCGTFGTSHFLNDKYADVPKTENFPNPWHVGTLDPGTYPNPTELIQGELELLGFMYSLVVQVKPMLVVETGTNVGLTARALGAGVWTNGFGRVVTSDTDQRMVDYAKKVCEGLPVEIRCCPSLDLPELRDADLVFIDSSYESRSQEHKLIKRGAVYVYHDATEAWVGPELEYERYRVQIDSPRGFWMVRKP